MRLTRRGARRRIRGLRLPRGSLPSIGAVACLLLALPPSPAMAQDGTGDVRLGHATVREARGRALAVFVDGVECGTTPWEGDLEQGEHEVTGQSASATAPEVRFTVVAGASTAVTLSAVARVGILDVASGDREVAISVDGRAVGKGRYRGWATVGAHVVRVSRPGYEPFEKRVTVGEGRTVSERVTLVPVEVASAPSPRSRAMVGPYGGVDAQLLFEPGGSHTDVCSIMNVTKCSVSSPVGGGLAAYAGYMTDPIGIDLMLGVQLAVQSFKGDVVGTPQSLTLPILTTLVAVRAKLAWETPAVRFSLAMGVGGAYNKVAIGASGDIPRSYGSPAVVLDGGLQLRVSDSSALSAGLILWGENAGTGVTVTASPLPTQVHPVESTQLFVMPTIGMEFGP